MRVLVLGATGMLGHKLMQKLPERFEVFGTTRAMQKAHHHPEIFKNATLIGGVFAEDVDSLVRAIQLAKPDAIVNCIGIIKQHAEAKDALKSIATNALFPHRLANLCGLMGIRMVHISTDCVFSGRQGNYTEDSVSDAEDLYGRSKYLGEVTTNGCLTLRTSIIGRELGSHYGLIEWFLGQQGKTIRGFTQAIFSGFTTLQLARIIGDILTDFPTLDGLWHVAAQPISKYDLLVQAKGVFNLDVDIQPDSNVVIDRSLDAKRFYALTNFKAPSWDAMLTELAADSVYYQGK
ncbi:MAG: SDR family oxidoreductase [Chloroflexi bacterium CFX4]|nr:SDR family oxidoreductase [Chloroflexi bacterium CFX4]MDL1923186.1 SDR family oxidoreductase [Chloroflexi bacterium CFX3]